MTCGFVHPELELELELTGRQERDRPPIAQRCCTRCCTKCGSWGTVAPRTAPCPMPAWTCRLDRDVRDPAPDRRFRGVASTEPAVVTVASICGRLGRPPAEAASSSTTSRPRSSTPRPPTATTDRDHRQRPPGLRRPLRRWGRRARPAQRQRGLQRQPHRPRHVTHPLGYWRSRPRHLPGPPSTPEAWHRTARSTAPTSPPSRSPASTPAPRRGATPRWPGWHVPRTQNAPSPGQIAREASVMRPQRRTASDPRVVYV
jgi:hypothetical protein